MHFCLKCLKALARKTWESYFGSVGNIHNTKPSSRNAEKGFSFTPCSLHNCHLQPLPGCTTAGSSERAWKHKLLLGSSVSAFIIKGTCMACISRDRHWTPRGPMCQNWHLLRLLQPWLSTACAHKLLDRPAEVSPAELAAASCLLEGRQEKHSLIFKILSIRWEQIDAFWRDARRFTIKSKNTHTHTHTHTHTYVSISPCTHTHTHICD